MRTEWISVVTLSAAFMALSGCSQGASAELRDVTLDNGTILPVCMEADVSPDMTGWIDIAALPDDDLAHFSRLGDDIATQTEIKQRGVDGTVYKSFISDNSADFKLRSVRAALPNCDVDIMDDWRQSALVVYIYGQERALVYDLFSEDGRLQYIIVRRRD